VKIKGIARQWEGGGFYRVRQPLEELARNGHEIVCEMAKSDVKADGADIIVGQFVGGQALNMSSSVSPVVQVHRWWRRFRLQSRLVYEMDDDPFEVEPHNPYYAAYMNPVAHDSISHCIAVADVVTVSTPVLAERIAKINPNVVVLQNRIDESLLTLERPKNDRLTIGWAGSHSHLHDIKLCAYGLRRIIDHHKDIDVHFVGADYRQIVGRPMRHTGWCVNTMDYYRLIDFDIGIAPLVPTRFAETKSHIKALEYAALGIPVIASDVDAYRDFVIDGVTGFLVRREHEWLQRLRDLINDEAMRAEMGAKSRALAAEWTIQKGWQDWEKCYKSLL